MGALTTTEQDCVERAAAERARPGRGVGGGHSGSRNLAGLHAMEDLLADECASSGEISLVNPRRRCG